MRWACGALLLFALGCGGPVSERRAAVLDLATTTSVRDSGLLEELVPEFSRETGVEVRMIVVGSGAALRMGADGDADVLVTHAPAGEEKLVAEGRLVDRLPFMRNFFVLAGPAADPAGIASASDVSDALRRIAAADAAFVSRADDSGTHRREKALFEAAGLEDWPAVLRTNAGMGASLQVAGERDAYILADVGTFRAFRARTGLVAYSSPDDPSLANVYSVSRPSPGGRDLNVDGAQRFAEFLARPDVQRRIAGFGLDQDGSPLFVPLLLPEKRRES